MRGRERGGESEREKAALEAIVVVFGDVALDDARELCHRTWEHSRGETVARQRLQFQFYRCNENIVATDSPRREWSDRCAATRLT